MIIEFIKYNNYVFYNNNSNNRNICCDSYIRSNPYINIIFLSDRLCSLI